MQEVQHSSNNALTIEELAVQIEEARKGKARVDSKYVGNADGLNHVFDYKHDYVGFVEDMVYVLKEAKRRRAEQPEDVYQNTHEMIIQ